MKTNDIIKGLKILSSYTVDKFSVEASHDIIHFSATTRVINTEDVVKLVKLGWLQDYKQESDFLASYYNSAEGWYCYV